KLMLVLLNLYGLKQYDTPALKAESMNHLTDLLVSGFVLLSVFLTTLFGFETEYYASLLVSIFILYSGFKLIKEGISFIVDEAPEQTLFDEIKNDMSLIPGVISIDMLKMRKHVNYLYIDAEIGVDESLSLKSAHQISENIHDFI